MVKENRRNMAVIDGSGGSAAVSLQLHIVHTYESHHIKGELWNSLIYDGCCSTNISKTTAFAPSLK